MTNLSLPRLLGRLNAVLLSVLAGMALLPAGVTASGPNVLLVGPAGTPGAQYTSIQAAVNAARAGDWILVAAGVYHEHGTDAAGVLIQKSNIHLRGMNRDSVVVDGTRASLAQRDGTLPAGSPVCSTDKALQDFGPKDATGNSIGRNGIMVRGSSGDHDHFIGGLADNVSIENLTVCNYLRVQEAGNQIWWNGGDGTGLIGMHGLHGDYISATDTYYENKDGPAGDYGIFTSNEAGPGLIDHSYASNMRDSSYYVGACRDCNVVLNHSRAEYSALGLSSTNAGGNLLVENGEWSNNRTGLVSNAQNNDDWPSPEFGQCLPPSAPPTLGGISAGPNSCYVMFNNYIHDNNSPNTPGGGLTAFSAIGTGIELVATQHVSVLGNRIEHNASWGVVTHDFPDPESGPALCQGGVDATVSGQELCTFFSRGNYVAQNHFLANGAFGNPSNGDVANEATGALDASACPAGNTGCVPSATNPDPNCYTGDANAGPGGLKADPLTLETAPCSVANSNSGDAAQLYCATGALSLFGQAIGVTVPSCTVPGTANYPQHDGVCTAPAVLAPAGDTANGVCFAPISRVLSAEVSPPMPDPCAGVPANAYCPAAAAAAPLILPPTSTAGPATGPAIMVICLLVAAFAAAVAVAAGTGGSRHPSQVATQPDRARRLAFSTLSGRRAGPRRKS
ncbi:MAG: hypothetical protein ABR573_02550 [Candidatus Dormibacteria bacterium]